jgi:hypothetical protein
MWGNHPGRRGLAVPCKGGGFRLCDAGIRRVRDDPRKGERTETREGYEIVFGPDLLELLNWELPDWIDADFLYPDFPPEEWGEAAAEGPSG